MPTSKTKKRAGTRPVRFVKSPQPGRRAPKRAVAKRAQARPAAALRKRTKMEEEDFLPDWRDLSGGKASRSLKPEMGGVFAAVSTLRMALLIIAAAAVVTLYVGHVYATAELLGEVESLRRENLELYLKHNQVKADFDRVSSPATIAGRARALGLVEAVPSGQPIRLDLR